MPISARTVLSMNRRSMATLLALNGCFAVRFFGVAAATGRSALIARSLSITIAAGMRRRLRGTDCSGTRREKRRKRRRGLLEAKDGAFVSLAVSVLF